MSSTTAAELDFPAPAAPREPRALEPQSVASDSPPAASPSLPGRVGRFLFSSSMLALVDQALVSGTNFVVGVMVARFAGIYEMGIYTLSYTLIVMAANVHYSLVGAPYTFIANQLPHSQRRALAGSALLQHLVVTLGLIAILLPAAGIAAFCGAPAWVTTATLVVGLACPFILLRELGRRCAFADLRVLTVVIIDGVATAMTLGSLYLLGLYGLLNGAMSVLVIGAAGGIVGLVWLVVERHNFAWAPTQFRGDVDRGWAFGKWVLASQSASVTSAYITHWTLAALLDAAATGAFAACQNVAQLANPLLFGMANVLEPKASAAMAHGGYAELRRVVNSVSRRLVAAVTVLAITFALFGEWAVRLLYGSAEPDLPPLVMPMLGLVMVCSALNVGLIHSLRAAQRSDVNVKADVLCCVVTLAVLLVDSVDAGVLIGTIAMLAGTLCGLALRYWGYRQVVYSCEVQS